MGQKKKAMGVLALATTTLVVGLGTPAQASTTSSQCQSNEKSFDIPWDSDVSVTVFSCVQRKGDKYRATAQVSWGSWGGMSDFTFDNLNLTLRLERKDATKASQGMNVTYYINRPDTYAHSASGSTGWVTSSARGGWTADGVVSYNINNDGLGGKKWELTGTPSIS